MYRKVLVPLDGSRVAEAALPDAVDLAEKNEAELVLLTVTPRHGIYSQLEYEPVVETTGAEMAHMESYLSPLVEKIKAQGLRASAIVLVGSVADTIVDYAQKEGVDVIVMSTHGRSGPQLWLLGSVAHKVLHRATVPVLLIRART